MEVKVNYNLIDDGGVSTLFDMLIKLNIGDKFQHEYGIYEVKSYKNDFIDCNRIVNSNFISRFKTTLNNYAKDRTKSVKEHVENCNKFFEEIEQDINTSIEFNKWIDEGSTTELLAVLKKLDCFNYNNLLDFNSFATMDSARSFSS